MSAAETRILSAIGSRSIPSVVTFLYFLAIQPSSKSVSAATRKTPSARYSFAGIRVRRTTTRSGTRKMRRSVSAFGRLSTAAHSRPRAVAAGHPSSRRESPRPCRLPSSSAPTAGAPGSAATSPSTPSPASSTRSPPGPSPPRTPIPGDAGTLPLVHDTRFLSQGARRRERRPARVEGLPGPPVRPAGADALRLLAREGARTARRASRSRPRTTRPSGTASSTSRGSAGARPPRRTTPIAACADRTAPRPVRRRRREGRPPHALRRRDRRAASTSTRSGAPASRVLWDSMHGAAGHAPRDDRRRRARDARDDDPVRASTPPSAASTPSRSPSTSAPPSRASRRSRFDVVLASDGDGDRLGVLAPDGRSSRPTGSSRSSPRASRRRGRIARRHRQDLLDVAPRRPRRGAARRPPPRHADRLQVDRREDAVGRGRDRRRGVRRPRRLVLPPRARRRPLRPPRPRGDRPLGRSRSRRSSRGRSASTARFAYGRRDVRLPMPVLRAFVDGLLAAPPRARAGARVTSVETLDGVKLLLGGRGWLLHRLSGNRADPPRLRRARGPGDGEDAPRRDGRGARGGSGLDEDLEADQASIRT